LQTQIKHRVKAVAATRYDRAAGEGNGHDFTARVGVGSHGQGRVTAIGRLPAKGERIGPVGGERHVQPAPFQPRAVSEAGVRRAEGNQKRRRGVAD